MADVVRFFFSLSGPAFTLVAGLVWLRLRPAASGPRRYLILVACAYLLAGTYGVDYLAGRPLALGFRPFSKADVPAGPTALVLLGSGIVTARDWDDNQYSVADPTSQMRVLEAVRVYHLANPAWVISSGGGYKRGAGPASAGGVVMRDDLVTLGVPAERILIEYESTNTRDEAVIIRPILTKLGISRVILVTSELHMRRAVGVFRAAGIEAIPARVRGLFDTMPWYRWIVPTSEGLAEAELLVHELLGIPYYWLRGWYK